MLKKLLISLSLVAMTSTAFASANIQIDRPSSADTIDAGFILAHSRPTFNPYYSSNEKIMKIGYYFTTDGGLKLHQFIGNHSLTSNTKLTYADVVPYGVVVDENVWDNYSSAVTSVEVDNCLDCALYEKTGDPYKLKEHLLSMRSYVSTMSSLSSLTRTNFALKRSTYDRLMKTNPKFAEARTKAGFRGYKLCPIVPDDFTGVDLQSYVSKIVSHIAHVETKMKAAIK